MVHQYCFIFVLSLAVTTLANEIQNHSQEILDEERIELCPDATEIFPCICTSKEEGLNMDCSDVTSTQSLANIFQKTFPNNTFNEFFIDQYGMPTYMTTEWYYGIFGDKTFRRIEMWYIKFNVSIDTFDDMNETLVDFFFYEVPFTDYIKNYNSFTKLNSLIFKLSDISNFFIQSSTLRILNVTYSNLVERSDGLNYNLGLMENLEDLHVEINDLTKPPSTVGYPRLTTLHYYTNNVEFIDKQSSSRNYLTDFSASSNNIKGIDVDSILVAPGCDVHLSSNQLTELESSKFENIFINASSIRLYQNPFNCGCDIAWLITNETYMAKLWVGTSAYTYTTCADGRRFIDLNPNLFDQCP